jgi:hypothetical protein
MLFGVSTGPSHCNLSHIPNLQTLLILFNPFNSGFGIASSNNTVFGCQSTLASNTTLTATYLSLMNAIPTLQFTLKTLLITSAVLNGLSVPVAWRPQDTTLFPSTAIPTTSLPTETGGTGLSKGDKIAVGVSLGVGIPVFVAFVVGVCYFGSKWMRSGRNENANTGQTYPMGYYDADGNGNGSSPVSGDGNDDTRR